MPKLENLKRKILPKKIQHLYYLLNKNQDATNELMSKTIQYLSVKTDKRPFKVTVEKNAHEDGGARRLEEPQVHQAHSALGVPARFRTASFFADSETAPSSFSMVTALLLNSSERLSRSCARTSTANEI